MRKLKRSVARANMKRAGITRLNKRNAGDSFFSKHWREYVKGSGKNAKSGSRAVRKAKRAAS